MTTTTSTILKRPDEQTARALYRLRGNDDWGYVRAWLLANLDRIRQENDAQLDEVVLRQSQGICQVIQAILTHQDEAEQLIQKWANSPTRIGERSRSSSLV